MAHFHIFIWYANKIVEFPGSKRNLLLRLPADLPMDLDPLAGDHLAAVTEVEVNLFKAFLSSLANKVLYFTRLSST